MTAVEISTKIKESICSKIDENAQINIIDETHKHQKHKGFVEGRYHFLVEIKSDILASVSRVKSHKQIFSSIDELMPFIHAFSIKIIK